MLFAVVHLLACLDPLEGPLPLGAISPADGQGSVPLTLPLRVAGPFEHPEGHPLPDAIRVEDVDRGVVVAGQVTVFDGTLQFVPRAPWSSDTRYLWTVRRPLPTTRGPSLELPDNALGSATFHTGDVTDVLAAAWRDPGELCLVLSRLPGGTELGGLRVSVDDEPMVIERLTVLEHADLHQEERFPGDEGLGGVCLVLDAAPVGAEQARVWIDDRSWLYLLSTDEPGHLADDLRRVP